MTNTTTQQKHSSDPELPLILNTDTNVKERIQEIVDRAVAEKDKNKLFYLCSLGVPLLKYLSLPALLWYGLPITVVYFLSKPSNYAQMVSELEWSPSLVNAGIRFSNHLRILTYLDATPDSPLHIPDQNIRMSDFSKLDDTIQFCALIALFKRFNFKEKAKKLIDSISKLNRENTLIDTILALIDVPARQYRFISDKMDTIIQACNKDSAVKDFISGYLLGNTSVEITTFFVIRTGVSSLKNFSKLYNLAYELTPPPLLSGLSGPAAQVLADCKRILSHNKSIVESVNHYEPLSNLLRSKNELPEIAGVAFFILRQNPRLYLNSIKKPVDSFKSAQLYCQLYLDKMSEEKNLKPS